MWNAKMDLLHDRFSSFRIPHSNFRIIGCLGSQTKWLPWNRNYTVNL